MERRDRIDGFGAAMMVIFAALFGFNQVVIAVTNGGLQPIFFAALRSAGGVLLVLAWLAARGQGLGLTRPALGPGVAIGLVFSAEFTCLFLALDLTTVTRVSVIFYSMPVWLAIGAHFLLPGERMTRGRAAGLALAFAGVAIAIADRAGPGGGTASLAGDLLALAAAVAWAGIALLARGTALREVPAETQLLCQLAVSAPVLMALAPLFGPLLRDPGWIHWAGLGFQIVFVAGIGFLLWLWLLTIYPAAHVAAFGFMTPLFGVGFGWALLGEPVGPPLLAALGLVAAGLWLVNRPDPVPRAGRALGR
jgi:drug/metabolite transporter (DMT)-like permease